MVYSAICSRRDETKQNTMAPLDQIRRNWVQRKCLLLLIGIVTTCVGSVHCCYIQDGQRASFLAGFLRYCLDSLFSVGCEKMVTHVGYLGSLVLEIAGKSWNFNHRGFSGIAYFCDHWSRFTAATVSILRLEVRPQASLKGSEASPPERVWLRLGAGRVLWWRVGV